MTSPQPLAFMFKDDGKLPNNPALPALIYKAAVDFGGNDPARAIERLFAQNGWGTGPSGNGIAPFLPHHHKVQCMIQQWFWTCSVWRGARQPGSSAGPVARRSILPRATSPCFRPAPGISG